MELLFLIIGLAMLALFLLVLRRWPRRPPQNPPASVSRILPAQLREEGGRLVADAAGSSPAPRVSIRDRLAGLWPFRQVGHTTSPMSNHASTGSEGKTTIRQKRVPGFHITWSLWQRILAAFITTLVLGTILWMLPGVFNTRNAGRFYVVVANFDDGGDGATGRLVADDLARVLREADERLVITRLDAVPPDAQVALERANESNADVLIWGQVQSGGLLDSPSLLPRLIYTPRGWHAPNAWYHYQGRFSMPRSFVITDQPLNGQVVLPRLIGALAEYHLGLPDIAADQLASLTADYPLNPALPRSLRGTVLWARGLYTEAIAEYGQAMAQATDEQARLVNNLAAIMVDARDVRARETLAEAIRLLEGRDLGALRFNLGMVALSEGRYTDAAVELEQARNLLPQNGAVLIQLAQVYRELGQFDAASLAIESAEALAGADVRSVPPSARPLMEAKISSLVNEQRGLVALSRQIQAQGPLAWELEAAPMVPPASLNSARDALRRAGEQSAEMVSSWLRVANAASAIAPGSGEVALEQSRYARRIHNHQRYELALVLIEQGRSQAGRSPGLVAGTLDALFSTGTPMSEAQKLLGELLADTPDNRDLLLASARALRYQGLVNEANIRYDEVIRLAPEAPEGYYGKATLALAGNDLDAARQLLDSSIQRDADFAPAYILLAQVAEQQNDWPTAIAAQRTLARLHPGDARVLALASTLRRSGSAAYDEARSLLTSLADAGMLDARLELGRLYREAGQLDLAIAAFEEARRLAPGSSVAAEELGITLAAAGRPAEAIDQLRVAANNDRGNTGARLALASLLQQGNHAEEASRQYRDVIASVADAGRLVEIGDTLLLNGDIDGALAAYDRAADLAPQEPGVFLRIARTRLEQGNLEGARSAAGRVVDLTANRAGEEPRIQRAAAFAVLGSVERRLNNQSGAQDFFSRSLATDPVQVEATIGLGLLAVDQGNWNVALGYFERAVAYPAGADSALAHLWLGEALLRQNNLDRAIDAYNRALELRPGFAEAQFGLAQALYGQQQLAAALERVNQALVLKPRYAEALLFKGKLLQERGDTDGALLAYNDSIGVNGDIAETRYRRGLIFVQRLDYGQAIGDFQHATLVQPNFPEANYWLGRSLFAVDRLDAALEALQRAVALQGSNYPEARYYQGLVEERLGRREQALASFLAVIQTDRSGEWSGRAQADLDRIQSISGVAR